MGYIYKITNDINNKVYIGETTRTISDRWKEHCTDYLIHDYPLYRAMRKYGIEHFFIQEIEQCLNEELNDREIYWIQYYDSYYNGYNATLGGDGVSRVNTDLIISLWKQGYSVREISRQTHYHRNTIQKHLNSNLENYNLKERAKICQGKKVAQIDIKTEEIINIFTSTHEAERQTGVKHNKISEVCNKKPKRKTAGGYKWEYIN